MTKTTHYAIKRLQKQLDNNPSAIWMKDWINCLAYQCSCKKCQEILRKNDVDVNMIDDVFK